jgi:hypothetical protein
MGDVHRLRTSTALDDRRLIDVRLDELRDLVATELRIALEGRDAFAASDAVPTKKMAEILGKHYSTLQKWTSIEGCPAFRCGQRPWAWPVEETKVWVREHFNG